MSGTARKTARTARRSAWASAVALAGMTAVGSTALAADLGGNCCADLDERIAELEATTARKGNRRVSLTVSGQVNTLVLWYDDGRQSGLNVADNINTSTRTRFVGSGKIDAHRTAGFTIELEYGVADSNLVSQLNSRASRNNGIDQINIRKSSWFLRDARYGMISLGLDSPPTDDIILSGITIDNAFPGTISDVPLIGGGIIFRDPATGQLVPGALRNVSSLFGSPLDTNRRPIFRYESPNFMGARLIAAVGTEYWDVGLWWKNKIGTLFDAEFNLGYFEAGTRNFPFRGQEFNEFKGSGTLLHIPSGLFLTGAWVHREIDSGQTPLSRTRIPSHDYYYLRPGVKRSVFSIGPTTVYGEYANAQDVLAGFASSGFAEVTSSEGQLWGGGVQQSIEAASAEIYAGYRHIEADIVGRSTATGPTRRLSPEDINLLWTGMRIRF